MTGRQAGENIETLGDTLAKMMAKSLDDIMPSRGKSLAEVRAKTLVDAG